MFKLLGVLRVAKLADKVKTLTVDSIDTRSNIVRVISDDEIKVLIQLDMLTSDIKEGDTLRFTSSDTGGFEVIEHVKSDENKVIHVVLKFNSSIVGFDTDYFYNCDDISIGSRLGLEVYRDINRENLIKSLESKIIKKKSSKILGKSMS